MDWHNIPQWLLKFVQHKKCVKCEQGICVRDIVAVGVRKLDNERIMPYFEYTCPTCQHRSVSVVETKFAHDCSLLEFCYSVIKEHKNKREIDRAVLMENLPGDEMRAEEIEEFIKFIRTVPTHEEFMKQIGSEPIVESDEDKSSSSSEDGLFNCLDE